MNTELQTLIEKYPKRIDWNDIIEFDEFDLRVSAVDSIVVNTISISQGFVEFCPDNNPPQTEEILCWIWAIRPDLTTELLKLNLPNPHFEILLKSYNEGNIDRFFQHMT